MGRMKVTIVTPVYNGMPWLPDCVNSVAGQRVDVEVEHLVFDGGSSDGSAEWLREHTALGYRATIGPDKGQTDALIKGFEGSTGDILGWLNADDMLEPGALRRVVEVFTSQPSLALLTAVCLLIDTRGAITGVISPPPVRTFEGLLRYPTNPAQPATFFSAEAYRRVGGLDRRYDLAMDVDLWLKLARAGPMEILPTEVLARFRVHPNAKSVAAYRRAVRQDLRIRRRHGMPIRSRAGVDLIRAGYVGPLVPRWTLVTRPIRRIAKRILYGRPDTSSAGDSR